MNGIGPLLGLSLGRLRRQPLRVSLSVLGVAAGVGLMFAVQCANGSLTDSYSQLQKQLAGSADTIIATLSSDGISQESFTKIQGLPGVRGAAPLTQHTVEVRAGNHANRVLLVGVDRRMSAIGGPLARQVARRVDDNGALGIYLPQRVSEELEVGAGDRVTVRSGGASRSVLVAGLLGSDAGALRASSIVVAPLGLSQQLTESQGSIQRILLDLDGRSEARANVEAALPRGARLTTPAAEAELLAQASAPDRQVAALLSAISLVVGALVAYNVMLLSVLERRREIAVMRMIGGPSRTLVFSLIVEALLIGVIGTALGLLLGWSVIVTLVERTPTYLQSAFSFVPEPVFPLRTILITVVLGIASAVLATVLPARTMLRISPAEALRGEELLAPPGRPPGGMGAVVAVVLIVVGAGLMVVGSRFGIAGLGAFIVGSALFFPYVVPRIATWLRKRFAHSSGGVQVATAELAAVPSRTTSIAAIAALTALVVVITGGAIQNLRSGTSELAAANLGSSDIWVSIDGDDNGYFTAPFPATRRTAVEQVPGVARVGPYRSAFVDWGDRRVLAFGFSADTKRGITDDEVADGSAADITRQLRSGPAVALSDTLARARDLEIGDWFTLPTPSGPARVQLAGTLYNYGWTPGVVAMDSRRFADLWRSSDVSALEVVLSPGADVTAAQQGIAAALGRDAGFRVETDAQARQRLQDLADEGLAQTRQILIVVILAAVLSAVAAMLTAVVQRARRIAGLRAIGMSRRQVYAALLVETGLVFGMGAVLGIVVAVPAQALGVGWISETTGFPVPFAPAFGPMALALGVALVIAFVAGHLPARRAQRFDIARGLSHE